MAKTKLLFVCSKFGGGGAEMHLLRVLSHADFDSFDIHLALTRDGGGYEQRLPAEVKVHYLTKGGGSALLSLIKSYLPLKGLIRQLKPDAVISIMDPQNLLLTRIKKQVKNCPPVIILCQNAPLKNLSNEGIKGKIFLSLIPKWYKHATQVIAICRGVHDELIEKLNVKAPVGIIYNAGYDKTYKQRAGETLDRSITKGKNQLIACGRLNRQKGFDVLLNALALIKDDTEFNMWILGEGEEKEKLTEQRDSLRLTDKVHFLGFQANPYKFYSNADIFVLSSRWEGFGNVLTEAMICDCAVISTDCDFGPNEIITDKENGLLSPVDDAAALAGAIKKMIADTAFRESITQKGHERAKAFASDIISREYFEEISRVIKNTSTKN